MPWSIHGVPTAPAGCRTTQDVRRATISLRPYHRPTRILTTRAFLDLNEGLGHGLLCAALELLEGPASVLDAIVGNRRWFQVPFGPWGCIIAAGAPSAPHSVLHGMTEPSDEGARSLVLY